MEFFFVAGLLFSCCFCYGQTVDEWFDQKNTQKKYLLQQIAALQIYFDHAKKGVEIAGKGLATIHQIKNGDFNIHRDFFQQLQTVSPAVHNAISITDIILLQIAIIKNITAAKKTLQDKQTFTLEEITPATTVFENILSELNDFVDQLIDLTSNNVLSMTTIQRLQHLQNIKEQMLSTATFLQTFTQDITLLSLQRKQEQTEINYSKLLQEKN